MVENSCFSPVGFKGNLSLLDIFSHFSRGRKRKWRKRTRLPLWGGVAQFLPHPHESARFRIWPPKLRLQPPMCLRAKCTRQGLSASTLCRFLSSALLSPFFGEGSTTKIDYREKGTLILTSLLEDLASGFRLLFPTFVWGTVPIPVKSTKTGCPSFFSHGNPLHNGMTGCFEIPPAKPEAMATHGPKHS